jgi:reversibly glycosylated polypeptide / UDP-arabinopyranose mutase
MTNEPVEQPKTAMVIPSCRLESFTQFAQAWKSRADWDATFVVVDGVETDDFRAVAADLPCPTVKGWSDLEAELNLDWIISRRDSAIRSYGFLTAYRDDAGFDLICTIDDDCYPHDSEFGHAKAHAEFMQFPAWQSTLDDTRVRGQPFSPAPKRQADVNIGLWEGVFDLSSVDQLARSGSDAFHKLCQAQRDTIANRVIAQHVQVPMCGMNLAFTRRAAPLMYFGLQGRSQPVGRFDDIWCGVIAKRICDHLGWNWTCGRPFVVHQRASNPFANLTKEAPGIVEHEHLMPFIMSIELSQTSAIGCFLEIVIALASYEPVYIPKTYFEKLAEAMLLWAELFPNLILNEAKEATAS